MIPGASDAAALRGTSAAYAFAERDVLTRERGLKASAPGGTSHTTYKYAIGPDGSRYIVGAEVSIIAPEDVIERLHGIRAPKNSSSSTEAASDAEPSRERFHGRNSADEDVIKELERTERDVIAHENAHKAAAGRFGGPVRYFYTAGPDGKRYISGGEVPIHTPATSDPEEALRNARQVMSAALAPGDPSPQDIAAAAGASAMAASAKNRRAPGKPDASYDPAEKAVRGYWGNLSPDGLWTSKNPEKDPLSRPTVSHPFPFDMSA
jgi:hypothetical protein